MCALMTPETVLVTGAGGFIGGHLVDALRRRPDVRVRVVDRTPIGDWHQRFDDVDNRRLDLRDIGSCVEAVDGVREKAPAAICRKAIEARGAKNPEIEISGDGMQRHCALVSSRRSRGPKSS